MVEAVRTDTRRKAKRATRRAGPEVPNEEEQVLRAATLYLIQKHGMFLVATGARPIQIRGIPVWVVSVTLRYDPADEGYVGDLLYDGEAFTFLTDPAVMDERVRRIAEDPDKRRQWDDYRATTLHPGEAEHLRARLPADDPRRLRRPRRGARPRSAGPDGADGNADR
jgi:hypothetical protein